MNGVDKNVLIISPEPWGISKISKHHYAIAFANKGYLVYFLTLHIGKLSKNIEICPDHKNIQIVNFPISNLLNKLRFRWRWGYNLIVGKKVLSWAYQHRALDLLLSFDRNGVFTNLSNFKAKKTIFFPVDKVIKRFVREYKGFDRLISISPVILESFPHVKNKILFNHGLSPDFVAIAQQEDNYNSKKEVKKIAYVGNLLIGPILDKPVLQTILNQHCDYEFHFFGAFEPRANNLGSDTSKESMEFIEFLKKADNCILHGMVASNILALDLLDMDAFLICYDYRFDKNRCSNAHKVLEYLALGKPIISTRISMYDNLKLFPMLDTFDNSNFPNFFKEQLQNWTLINTEEAFSRRKDYALKNSYSEHANKIEEILGKGISQLPL
ncbi:hypothetical protein K8352_17700 [Flavobacteriaceae bacterium F89]|uniref:Glycosyltransferase n=1 Tax=Cerina litoralis TaxID=2874477 RepID=A0AAE3JQW9_9FLAO|nr:hypothetical protein [Cerina litoralis]MCG2462601.1 hypothetical protein [Cerina litoralis]